VALFVLTCIDRKNGLERRMAARPAHLAYVAANSGKVKIAGPLLDDEGQMAGSLFIIEADDKAEVAAFSAADPYVLNDVFETVEIRAFKVTVGQVP
jgi:uncharacterized protein YciI